MIQTTRLATILSLILTLTWGCSESENPTSTQEQANVNQANVTRISSSKNTKPPQLLSPNNPDPAIQQNIDQYVASLAAKGFTSEAQGIWLQTEDDLLASHKGTTPLPAASITKIATSLAALSTFGVDHQFITKIGTTGTIENGVIQGDLVIEGGQDPLLVWEDAIALGNVLNEMGIQRITGDLIIVDQFYMNFEENPQAAGELFKEGIDASSWSTAAATQYSTLPPGTPKPQVKIAGEVKVSATPPANTKPLIRHASLPMAELVKKMNQYSNNKMAEMLANSVGGAEIVAQKAAELSGVPQEEIILINGSGLGEENRISPRASVAMFLAINNLLEPHNMTVGDVVTIIGEDPGVLEARPIPKFAVTKSGTLNNVSALAGALPTEKETIWFAILNYGSGNLKGFHASQESLLQQLTNDWGVAYSLPPELSPSEARVNNNSRSERVR